MTFLIKNLQVQFGLQFKMKRKYISSLIIAEANLTYNNIFYCVFFLNILYQKSMDQRLKIKEAKAAFLFSKINTLNSSNPKCQLKISSHPLIMLKHDIQQYFFAVTSVSKH